LQHHTSLPIGHQLMLAQYKQFDLIISNLICKYNLY
jgi:hypothetical protein